MPVSIKVEQLCRTYIGKGKDKKQIIANHNLAFEVSQGETFGLLGPNGAGKTTLILQILGLLKPTSGYLWVEGINVLQSPELLKRMSGFLPQSGLPMRYVPVESALFYTGRLRGQNEAEAKKQAKALIEELGLGDYCHRPLNRLSGGMLRLACFAMSLMGYPRLLVLDEPTNELDPYSRRVVWDKIERLRREEGATCLLVTHNVLEAEKVVQRVGVLQQGHLIALGSPDELKTRSGGRVRLEFKLKEGFTLNDTATMRLSELAPLENPLPGHYRLHLPPDKVSALSGAILSWVGFEQIADFRLAPPSLEDVYLELEQLNRALASQRKGA